MTNDSRRTKIRAIAFMMTRLALLICVVSLPAGASDTLPQSIPDDVFWKLISSLSEPGGSFQSENLLSNETDFPQIMGKLKDAKTPGGVYMGVGPEQNFNYIAAIQPRMAFIIDIRRQNMIEHLLYKALFELSPDRTSFLGRLFSREQTAELTSDSTAAELFDAYIDASPDEKRFEKNLQEIEARLIGTHHFQLTLNDREALKNVYAAFRDFGPLINYNSRGGGAAGFRFMPSYALLMTQTDNSGREWSYVASEASYRTVRDLQLRNLIVPLTGDFGGSHAIRAVGRYVKEHGARISAFYTSNVEGYLFRGGDRSGNPNGGASRFYENVSTLPLDKSSTFIRWIPDMANGRSDSSMHLAPILETIEDFNTGQFSADDIANRNRFRRNRVGGFTNADPLNASVPGSSSEEKYLRFGSYLLTAAAFLVRLFLWRPNGRERVTSMRTIVYSSVWAVGGYVLAAGIAALVRFLT